MLNVVKEQITRALDKKQLPPSLENFRQNLSNCSYDHLFLQVLNVVKEQITRALDKKQLPPSLENFRQNLSNCSYDHLKQIWEMERKTTEEKEAQARPIVYVCLFLLMFHHSQQFISHVGTFSCISGLNQY